MATGENFMRINRNTDIEKAKNKLQETKENLHNYLKENNYHFNEKALKLEKKIELAEYNLYCIEYEDNRRRTWK